jgi:hypothetical protein
LYKLAREHSPEAIAKIMAVMRNPKSPAATQLQAAGMILDRAYG